MNSKINFYKVGLNNNIQSGKNRHSLLSALAKNIMSEQKLKIPKRRRLLQKKPNDRDCDENDVNV